MFSDQMVVTLVRMANDLKDTYGQKYRECLIEINFNRKLSNFLKYDI